MATQAASGCAGRTTPVPENLVEDIYNEALAIKHSISALIALAGEGTGSSTISMTRDELCSLFELLGSRMESLTEKLRPRLP